MPKSASSLDLEVDLETGVVPISKAASALAALIKRGRERQKPIVVTQKGYPSGVLLPISLYTRLRELAQREIAMGANVLADVPASVERAVSTLPDLAAVAADEQPGEADELDELDELEVPPEPRRGRGGRRSRGEDAEG